MTSSFQLFSEPKLAFSDIFKELEKAQKSIYIESYLLDDDSVGQKLISILKKKAQKIPVTVLIDDYGFKTPSKETLETLAKSRIEFSLFNPIRKLVHRAKFGKIFQNIRMRNHRKLTLIDSHIAYVGGMNYSAKELPWRDIMVKMQGQVVQELKLAAKEMRRIHKNWVYRKVNPKLHEKRHVCRQIPAHRVNPLRKRMKKVLREAKEEIYLTTPYFIPDIPMLAMLRRAVKRKVKVVLLVPHKSDHYYADILTDFFIRVAYGLKIEVHQLPQVSHAKYCIVDKKICTFGSANFDYQAFNKNYELNIFTKDNTFIKELRKLFEKDLKRSDLFTPKLKQNITLKRKLLEKILFRFKEQF